MAKGQIAPSIMCANFKNLEKDVAALQACGAEYMHFDIMDGAFVPNFTLGPDVMRHVRELTSTPFDVHLMVLRPEEHLHRFGICEGDYVSIHAEACYHLERTLKTIRDMGAKPMLALNPATPLSVLDYVLHAVDAVLIMTVNPGYAGQKLIPATLDKISDLRRMLDGRGFEHVEIEVDGNVSMENAKLMRGRGADIFVAGSASLFAPGKDIASQAALLREAIL